MIIENYNEIIWLIATGMSKSIIFFIPLTLVFDYLRTMLFNNR